MGLEKAYFGMQCFWGESVFAKVRLFHFSCQSYTDSRFQLKGVHNTRVGYAGGKTKNPTYKGIADHTGEWGRRWRVGKMSSLEVTEVKFDPSVLSYRELVDFFWSHHDPVGPRKKQYQSAILYVNEEQKKARRRRGEGEEKERNYRLLKKQSKGRRRNTRISRHT